MNKTSTFFKVFVGSLAACAAFAYSSETAQAQSDPYLGDIKAVGYNFCSRGWALADGQLLPIASNSALYSLLGTTYGGDGRTTFGLPDLRDRAAMGQGQGPGLTSRTQGQKVGTDATVLTLQTMPSHNHLVFVNNEDGDKKGPGDKRLAAAPPNGTGDESIYSTAPPNKLMSAEMIAPAGQASPAAVQTRDPYLGINFCIAVQGLFPSRP